MKKSMISLLVLFLFGCSTINEFITDINDYYFGGQNEKKSNYESPNREERIIHFELPESYDKVNKYRNDKKSEIIKKIPKSVDNMRKDNPDLYIESVIEIINTNANDDYEKVKMAHDVIAEIISYDVESFLSGYLPNQDYKNVLKSGLAVCDGYSSLLKRMCDGLYIKCEKFSGYARGAGISIYTENLYKGSNHAWNIVTINKESFIIDNTWDAGYLDGKSYKREYSTDWLFINPKYNIYTHFPDNPSMQLLEDPITISQFAELPSLRPDFFQAVDNDIVEFKKINEIDNEYNFKYQLNESFQIIYKIYDINDGKEIYNRTFISSMENVNYVDFSLPFAGNFLVRIFGKKLEMKQYEIYGEFIINSQSSNIIQYPTIYPNNEFLFEIISPIKMPLVKGEEYNFKLKILNKENVAIIQNKEFVQLDNEGNDIFSINYRIPTNIKEIIIGVSDSARGRYDIIAKYIVK